MLISVFSHSEFSNGSLFSYFSLISSPAHIDSHRNFPIWYEHAHMPLIYAEYFLVIVTFFLLPCPFSHRKFILHWTVMMMTKDHGDQWVKPEGWKFY